jgi:SAM-dependent methyltransferase
MSTTTAQPTTGPDLVAIKTRQQATWASGDYAAVATRIQLVSERLVDVAELRAGSRVLDVATGSGNAALAAARYDCDVVGIDYVPELLERARARAAAEGLTIEFVEGDAEDLPFPGASFDAVTSVFGVMFAPDQEKAAAELLRVCRPGGTIALASWTPSGYLGEMFKVIAAHVPPAAGLASPMRWGDLEAVNDLLGDGICAIRAEKRVNTFRFRSPEISTDFFKENYGPTLKTFAALDEAGQDALYADLIALIHKYDLRQEDGPVAVPGEYLEVIATRS